MVASKEFGNFMTSLGVKNPTLKKVGYNYAPFTVQTGQQTPGQNLFDKVTTRKTTGADIYNQNRADTTNRVASDIAGKSAFNIPTDEFGLVNNELTDNRPAFTAQLDAINQRGKNALATEEAKTAWQQAKSIQDLGQYGFSGYGTDVPGATSDNPGAKAVSLAMQAQKNGTPYVWGGNSLNTGVDCSGLVQQVYRQLGIDLPRTTWQQAKSGHKVDPSQIRPGDLVFYNNGAHVGIYIGNGQIVHAANSKLGTIVSSLHNSNSWDNLVIRPY